MKPTLCAPSVMSTFRFRRTYELLCNFLRDNLFLAVYFLWFVSNSNIHRNQVHSNVWHNIFYFVILPNCLSSHMTYFRCFSLRLLIVLNSHRQISCAIALLITFFGPQSSLTTKTTWTTKTQWPKLLCELEPSGGVCETSFHSQSQEGPRCFHLWKLNRIAKSIHLKANHSKLEAKLNWFRWPFQDCQMFGLKSASHLPNLNHDQGISNSSHSLLF